MELLNGEAVAKDEVCSRSSLFGLEALSSSLRSTLLLDYTDIVSQGYLSIVSPLKEGQVQSLNLQL